MYARLSLEEEEDEGIVITDGEIEKPKTTYTLIGHFLTDKNINFNVMQNVLASLLCPKEGIKYMK